MLFFDCFLKDIMNKDYNYDPIFKNYKFRNFVIDTRGKTIPTIRFLQLPLAHSVKKPQRCLYNDTDYYLALDTYSKTYYICFKQLLMIDIDIGKKNHFTSREEYLDFIRSWCEKHPEFLFKVYKTRNGLHLFAVHETFDYQDDETLQLMIDLHCDFYYIIYSSLRGWSVRLNKKMGEQEEMYEFIENIGKGREDIQLGKLVELHKLFSNLFADRDICLMK